MVEKIRLQKFLAQCGVASRRKAEELIAEGRIRVGKEIVTTPGFKIDPATAIVFFDNKRVKPEDERIYILLNKPKGYVTTLSDPQGRPIVTSLIPDIDARIFPVGRLDLDTQGALILTNDGDLAQKIQHPSKEVTKTYEAMVYGWPAAGKVKTLEEGFLLEGKMTSPASLTILKKSSRSTLVQITIHEGRKRQVRKMFDAIGHPVISLKRVAYGQLYLRKLPEGQFRKLNNNDLKKIFKKFPLQKKK